MTLCKVQMNLQVILELQISPFVHPHLVDPGIRQKTI